MANLGPRRRFNFSCETSVVTFNIERSICELYDCSSFSYLMDHKTSLFIALIRTNTHTHTHISAHSHPLVLRFAKVV